MSELASCVLLCSAPIPLFILCILSFVPHPNLFCLHSQPTSQTFVNMKSTVPTINVVGHEVPLPAYFKIVSSYNERGMSPDAIVAAIMKYTHPGALQATRHIVHHVTDNLQRMKAECKETVVQVPLDRPFAQYSPVAHPQSIPTPQTPFKRSVVNLARPRPNSLAAAAAQTPAVIDCERSRSVLVRSATRPAPKVSLQSPLQHLEALTDAMSALTCAEEVEIELSQHYDSAMHMRATCTSQNPKRKHDTNRISAMDIEQQTIVAKQRAASEEVAKAKARVQMLQKRSVMPRGR